MLKGGRPASIASAGSPIETCHLYMKFAAQFVLAALVAALAADVSTCSASTQAAQTGQVSSVAAYSLREAIVAAQHGDSTRALALTQQLLTKHPAYGPGLKFEGALLEEAGHAADAEACYEQALKLTPTDPDLLFKVGVGRLAAGDYGRAITLLQQAGRKNQRDSDTLYYLAQAYHLSGDNDSALKAIAKSAQLDPKNAAVLEKYGELLSSAGNNIEAVDWLRKAQSLDPALARLDFDLGIANFRNQDLDEAAQYADRAVRSQPNDVKALELLAEVDVKLAHWQDAKGVFERLLAINPNDAVALLGLGHSELGLKDYQSSVDTLKRVLDQEPTTILAHFYLSRAYAGLGRQADAAHETELHNKLVEQAASIVPTDEREVEKATLLEARKMLADGHEQQALQLFRERSKGPSATPGSPYMLVGVSYLYMRRPEDANRCLKKAIEIEPRVRLAHTYLGLLSLQHDDLAEAERQFDLELQQDPNSQLAVAELGEVRYRQGRWAEAAEHLSRSRTVSPALLYLLSDAYFHLDQLKDADLAAELAADYGKDDPAMVQRIIDMLNNHHQPELAQRLAGR
jgi:tetratricopeptide (TPR) repeat protein